MRRSFAALLLAMLCICGLSGCTGSTTRGRSAFQERSIEEMLQDGRIFDQHANLHEH